MKQPLRVIEALRRYSEVRGLVVEAGFPGALGQVPSKGHEGEGPPPSVLQVAVWNEFGTETSPPRPFMRQTVTRHRVVLRSQLAQALRDYGVSRTPIERVAARLGVVLRGAIQETITAGEYIPNAPYTIARKKSSRPLIDTGQMRQSVRWRARLAGREIGASGGR
jgi:uncharacterized protein YjiS (DUF1127 family)